MRKIKLSELQADPNQPRTVFDPQGIEELGISIEKNGQRLAVKVKKITGGGAKKYQLINGERRFRAHSGNKFLIEQGTILAKVEGEELTPEEIFLEQIADNSNRQNLSAGDQIMQYKTGADKYGTTPQKFADLRGISVKTVQRDLELAELPPAVIHSLDDGDISKELCSSLLVFKTEAQQLNGLQKALEAKSPKQALANVEFYRKQVAGEESKIVKAGKEDNESIKSAGRRIDKFIQQVGTFATFAENNISLAIKSRSREIEKLEAHAKALKKLAEQIQNGCAEYRAVGNKQ